MKAKFLIIPLAIATLMGSAVARTWTSSDGEKTFEGRYIEHDDSNVTVMKSGRKVTFPLNKLSDDDQKWVLEQKPEEEVTDKKGSGEKGSITEQIESKLSILKGKRFARHKLTKSPEYYLVYFSASW